MSSSTSGGPPTRAGLSLYANLLDSSASSSTTTAASISREPVVFKPGSEEHANQGEAAIKKQQIDAGALRFQPTRRPQLASQKAKPKNKFPKAPAQDASPAEPEISVPSSVTNTAARPPVKSTLADWTAADDDDVNGFYGGEKRQRGGRKRRKKNKTEYAVVQDWDDVYDPSRPNNYEEYKNSDEKIREVREWKDRLYAHRTARQNSSEQDSDEEADAKPSFNNQFAPPPNYSFAPPPMDSAPPRPSAPVALVKAPTGDDAYARRLRLSPEIPPTPDHVPPPHLSLSNLDTQDPSVPPPSPPSQGQGMPVISRAPVRYNLPAAPSELPSSEAELEKALAQEEADDGLEEEESEEQERSRRPGQKGFAERLMSKYGWSKGSGLGADGSGITTALRVQVEKRKKKSDAEGGGFRDPGGRGKIIGGKKKTVEKDDELGKFGAMSEVIVLKGMVDGMDLDEEVDGPGDGGLMQEIGDECSEKYGRVERVYIDRHSAGPAKVFVKFTSQLSGLRAVNALEGRIFNGNSISALFYDTEKFEQGIYD